MSHLDYSKTAQRWQRYGEEYLKEARDLLMKVSSGFTVAATSLSGLVVIWIQNHKGGFSVSEIVMITLLFAALAVSVLFGMVSLSNTHKFMNRVGRAYERKATLLQIHMMNTGQVSGGSYPEDGVDLDVDGPGWEVRAQAIALMVGVVTTAGLVLIGNLQV